jgi:phosphate:Na+ symporter
MSMTISILGGVGLFLLGMSVMTGGLKTLAGPALRRCLARQQQHRCATRSGVPW